MAKKEFASSFECMSRAHCISCRDTSNRGQQFRKSLLNVFILPENRQEFECPHSVPWGQNSAVEPSINPGKFDAQENEVLGLLDAESDGLGDTIAKLAHEMGADKAAKFWEKITGFGCGCEKRRKLLNQWWPYKKPATKDI